ncbi:MAG: hypothetical protein ACPG7R_03320, partial [Planctomycetota bacterium]
MSADFRNHSHSGDALCRGQRRLIGRREMLAQCASGFGAVAFSALMGDQFGALLEAAPIDGKTPP